MKICVIGSSKRHDALLELFKETNNNVTVYGKYEQIPEKITAECIVFPIPTIKNGRLNIVNAPEDVLPEDIVKRNCKAGLYITCGHNPPTGMFVDISDRDDFAYLNAVPTAEGAVKLAIDASDVSVSEQKMLVLGFGRVGKILAQKLKGLGCAVTVGARSLRDLSYAEALGLNTVKISELNNTINIYDTVFQTVPARILDEKLLKMLRNDCVVIELSSAMKGTDTDFAKKMGLTIINAGALPEKTAPVTAGRIWGKTLLSVIAEYSAVNGGEG